MASDMKLTTTITAASARLARTTAATVAARPNCVNRPAAPRPTRQAQDPDDNPDSRYQIGVIDAACDEHPADHDNGRDTDGESTPHRTDEWVSVSAARSIAL